MARYWEWSAPFKIDPKDTALIIVDMQRGFVDEGFCFYTPDANAQIPVIAQFKQFCKEKGIPVFLSAFVQDESYHNDYYWFRNKERGLLNEDGTCKLRRGTPDGEITDALAPTGDDTYFTKYTYSCFAHTQLEEQLRAKGIHTVIVCGTCTNWCVDSTIRDAYHKDFNVVALTDCISTFPHAGADAETWNKMEFDLWGEGFARVMDSKQAMEEISEG